MEPAEKAERIFRRFGLVFSLAGAALVVLGLLLIAGSRHWVPISRYLVYTFMEWIMGFLCIVGTLWQMVAAWRDGFLWDNRYTKRFIPHGCIPLVIIVTFITCEDAGLLSEGIGLIAAGLGLVVSGAWTMQVRLPPPPPPAES
ncbi:MAG TPA: hypothetical protein DD417_15920 [Elusimicrobia bacterium]|nr:hypothetical protein [Elusimicrobiota bacterium]